MNIQDIENDAEQRDMALTPTGTKPSYNGRLYKEVAVYEMLEKLEILYWRIDHEMTATVENCLQ